MKKLVSVIFIFALCATVAFGAVGENVLLPNYVTCQKPSCNIEISNMGVATVSGLLKPINTSSVDKVTMNFKLDRVSGGTLLNETYNATWNSSKGGYYSEKNCNLVRNGIYELKVVFKCYKNGQLVETISDVVAKREIY